MTAHPYETVMKCHPQQRRWKCGIRIHKLTHNVRCRLLKAFGVKIIAAQIVVVVFIQVISWNMPIRSVGYEVQPQAAMNDQQHHQSIESDLKVTVPEC